MEITKDMIRNSETINEGTTCYIMKYNDIVFKLYKGAIDYILNDKEYKLEEEWTKDRLNFIISKRNDVKLTDLPTEVLTFNDKPAGVVIKYYDNAVSLKYYLEENYSEDLCNSIKGQMLNIVNELIENGIVPTDPHFENFVIKYNEDGSYELKMIDSDDQYVEVYKDDKKDVWYESNVSACYRVIDLSFDNLNKEIRRQ